MNESRPTVRLHVVIPFHQPLTRTDAELDLLWTQGYAPLLAKLGQHRCKVAIHISGHLADFLTKRREATLMTIKRLVEGKRLEVLGGLYYGALPALVPELDVRGQAQMMTEYWESVLGTPPAGFWLPGLGWSVELPRLLQETGLAYGFVSRSQLTGRGTHGGLAVIERGEQRVSALILDPTLSAALPSRPVDEWVAAVLDRAACAPGPLSVWLPAERLFAPDGEVRLADEKWLDAFLSALGGARSEIQTVLPSESITVVRPAAPVRITERVVPESAGKAVELGPEWTAVVEGSAELEAVHRRMLRVSEKLREAIAAMESEELDDSWSDALATAQRLLFAAQAPDAYLAEAGARGEPVRAATLSRLVQAEAMIDGLVQGDDDWIATEEEDADADLVDETFACTRRLTACVVPARGFLSALDDRMGAASVLDASLTELTRERGEWVLDAGTSAAALFSGRAQHLLDQVAWEMHENRIDEEGDCAFHLHTSTAGSLAGQGERRLELHKKLLMPIDRAELVVSYEAALADGPAVLLAMPLPLRLSAPLARLLVNQEVAAADARTLDDVAQLRLEAEDGRSLELTCEPPCKLWLQRLSATSLVLVPTLGLAQGTAATYTLAVAAAAPSADEQEGEDTTTGNEAPAGQEMQGEGENEAGGEGSLLDDEAALGDGAGDEGTEGEWDLDEEVDDGEDEEVDGAGDETETEEVDGAEAETEPTR